MMRSLMLAVAVMIPYCPMVSFAAGNEVLCATLGANCICSEPLNTNTFTVSNTNWFNPGDTTTNECSAEGAFAGGAMASASGWPATPGVNSGAAITALPAGHTNTYVFQTGQDATIENFLGTKLTNGVNTARRSIRWYQYYSSDYSFTGDVGTCNSGKIAQFGPSSWQGPMFVSEGIWSFYDIETAATSGNAVNFNQDANCCQGPGPGNYQTGPNTTNSKDRWWMIEIAMHNGTSSGDATVWNMWIRDVTNNGSELHVLDTSQTKNNGAQDVWTTTNATTIKPMVDIDGLYVNMYRGGTGCTGFAAYANLLIAAWDTDAGQRIGAATEVEGSGAQTYSGSLSGVFRMQGVGVWR